jgi:hypothetical protein
MQRIWQGAWIAAVLWLGAPPLLGAEEPVVRSAGETPEELAKRIVPSDATLSTRPVEVALPPLGKVIVVLFVPASPPGTSYSNYRGWVLVPDARPRSYRKENLPPLKSADGMIEYDVKAVFTADADGDGLPEICVLADVYRTGSGEDGHYSTDLYKWSSKSFVRADETVRASLIDLPTAKDVRARLKKRLRGQAPTTTSAPAN